MYRPDPPHPVDLFKISGLLQERRSPAPVLIAEWVKRRPRMGGWRAARVTHTMSDKHAEPI